VIVKRESSSEVQKDGVASLAPEPDRQLFRDELVAEGLLVLTGTDGLYGHSSVYESIAIAIDGLVSRTASSEGAIGYRFPPVMPRWVLEQTGYLSSFPDMVGSVSTFKGGDRDHINLLEVVESGGEWMPLLEPAEVTLCPAVCHPLYPTLKGILPDGGLRYSVSGWCYRHEPSVDPARMQSFRQHDLVYVGDAAGAREHRNRWLQLGIDVIGLLGVMVEPVVANDPFFGRVGRILADNQREEALKYELVTSIHSADYPTAIASANCHLDHFGRPFGIETATGEVAHSCCFGFGIDRISLALLRTHGMRPGEWPTSVRNQLWP
jgi:seryl-tRNA synthetase